MSQDTVVAVLSALGIDASTPEAIEAALEQRRLARWRRMLPPCLVMRPWWANRVHVHVPHGAAVEVWVDLEGGGRRDLHQVEHLVDPVDVDGQLVGEAAFAVPEDLPMGWHQVQARSPDRSDTAALVITPAYLGVPDQLGRLWGLAVQLYAVRSHRSWGLGDAADLADLAGWSGRELGAGFVLVNPLHAADPIAPMEPSPYLPSSRRFLNPMYIRVEEVPEFGYLSLDDRTAIEQLARPCRSRNGTDDLLDRDAIWAAKKAALELVFAVSRSPGRQAAYVAFREEHGEGLVDFATWCALAERHGLPWRAWPEEPGRTLPGAGGRPYGAGRAGGLLRLAPVGRRRSAGAHGAGPVCRHAARCRPRFGRRRVHEGQTRALQHVLASGVTVGAPGDAFNQQGQDWRQPPWHPQRLAEAGYQPYRDMVRTILRHAGGLRVDHVVGLFRLWWVPEGFAPADET